jgi:hypothetical protein
VQYLGDIAPSQILYFGWHSNAIAGESITRATNGTVSVYKDDGTTQSTTGVTDTEDFDGLTGVHWVKIDTSADGTFYAAGHDFAVVLSAATIDGKTINAVLGHFSINNRSALRPTTAGRTLDVSAGGEAGVDWANVGSPTTAQNLSGTNIKTDQVVASVTGAVGSVTGAVGSVTGAVGSVGAGGITASSLASDTITAAKIAADAITAAKIATNAIDADALATDAVSELQSGLATSSALAAVQADTDNIQAVLGGITPLDAAGVRSAVGLASANLDTQLSAVQADTDDIQTRLPAALVSGRMSSEVGSVAANAITDAGVGTDLDTYQARVDIVRDSSAGTPTDRYIVTWFRNGMAVLTGITSPTIQVWKASDGSDLIASTAMAEIASTQTFKYDATTTARITVGAAYVAKIGATIDGTARVWTQVVGRDS